MKDAAFYLSKRGDFKEIDVKIPQQYAGRLKPFQICGIRFIYRQFDENKGAILNDDEELGKRVQSILFLSAILSAYPTYNALIVCGDESMKYWLDNFKEWSDETASKFQKDKSPDRIVLATPDEFDKISRHKWNIVIVDNIKPVEFVKKCSKIACKFKLWLADNNLMEDLNGFYSILTWIGADINMKFDEFDQFYGVRGVDIADAWKRRQALQIFSKAYYLRRNRSTVKDELPNDCVSVNDRPTQLNDSEIDMNSQSVSDCDTDDSRVIIVEAPTPEMIILHSSQSTDSNLSQPLVYKDSESVKRKRSDSKSPNTKQIKLNDSDVEMIEGFD